MAANESIGFTVLAKRGDDIAVQQTTENERSKAEQQQLGGTLERYINLVPALNFSFVLQISWEAAAATFQFSLSNGGPASIVYGSIFSGIGTTLVAISLAEMASMDPTVGAQYRWSAAFAPGWKEFFGLMQGWITVFAWICSCTSNPALISNVIIGLINFNNPGYVVQRWHVTLLMWALTVLPFVANLWFRQLLNPIQFMGAFCHVLFFFVSIITLVVLAERSSATYVFHTLTNDISGWTNPTVAWGIGLLTVTYPLTGFDGVLHISDEVKKARLQLSRSMISSVVVNALMQFVYMVTVLFTIGDVNLVSSHPLPIIQVYYQATGSKSATNVFISMLGIIFTIAFFNVFASVSRLLWAFSRDNGLPFSNTFAQIHPTLKQPLNSLILLGACVCLLALINIGSSTAFNAFISLPALGLYISYFFPILFLLWRRLSRSHAVPIPWGPFKLGAVGPIVNLGALCYIAFVLIWMPFPAFLPVDATNMNYAGPILGAVILGALVGWVVSGKTRFRVPVARNTVELD
ncbi:hypothetical protein OPT61_g4908 [Boeremia exigua]|uniref:Uncharacterized protein n=1 Tax=Boeremia exigua TaxID=749465 RepID=A0ACC2IC82_9PLEO|nr:hypothetical protein OPT61_g4908 [Boeremia exigua]